MPSENSDEVRVAAGRAHRRLGPGRVEGCADCLELVAKDLEDTGTYAAVTCIAGRRSPSGVLPPGGRRSGGPALTAADRVVTRPTLVFRSIFDSGVIRLVQPMTPETGKM